ncbi:hypothetical protein BJX65DRAFT_302610 [Aspergillus insuetus]
MPDIRPKPNKDCSCFSYTVQPGDDCSTLAVTYRLTNTVLERFNNRATWGWNGCWNLNHGITIRLSNGEPPMPAPVANAVCGLTKPATERPTDGTPIEDLNPCPLNSVRIVDTYKQWEDSKSLENVRRIISFGGWGYSTEPDTYDILREAMSPPKRKIFATNVAAFVAEHELNGVDFDWEYPGAIDIPGTPPGLETDGPNYYKFLIVMRAQLAEGKSLSIAAPASYWYLKAFPLAVMSKELDYIVFMTYDLHGQWDTGNQYATEGCPTGNCLRSHVNLTETAYALSMSKPSSLFLLIVLDYFPIRENHALANSNVQLPKPESRPTRSLRPAQLPAAKGVCTDTSGYISNAEIDDIEILGEKAQTWHDGASNSDITVYNWVAYMSWTTKETRRIYWRSYNFAGTIDWAVDLQSYTDDEYYDYETGEGFEDILLPLPDDPVCRASYDDLKSIEKDFGSIDEPCIRQYIPEALQKNFTLLPAAYDGLMEDGYDGKFKTYAKAVISASNKTIKCCGMCEKQSQHPEVVCRYCQEYDCVPEGNCDNPEVHCETPEYRYLNMTQPCPPDYSLRGQYPTIDARYTQSVYWTLEDPDAFWADLYTETGVAQEDIEWKDVNHFPCYPTEKHCADRSWDYNFPVTSEYDLEDVINPKDVVSEAYDKLKALKPELDDVVDKVKNDEIYGDINELIDAVSMPVLMVSDAIGNMQSIVEIAEEIEEAKAKSILFAFLSAIFFFVPVIGEVMGTLSSLASIGHIVTLLGATGNVVLDVYTIFDDPDNAPLAIFSLVLNPLALLDAVKVGQAARARRGMPARDVAKLGDRLNARLNIISKLKDRCTI